MSTYTQFSTALTVEQASRVPVGECALVDVHTVARALNAPSGSRPRIYAYLERGESAGQIVALRSLHYLEQYDGLLGFAWTSSNTITDMIRKA